MNIFLRCASLLFFIVLSNPSIIYAQQIGGVVLDETTNNSLEDVNITNKAGTIGTSTDADGRFYLQNKRILQDSLTFSYVGYFTRTLSFSDLENMDYVVKLVKSSEGLSTITLTQNKLQKSLKHSRLKKMPLGLYDFSLNILNDTLYIFGGNESEKIERAKQLLERYAEREFLDLVSAMQRNRDMAYTGFNSAIYKYDLTKDIWEKDTNKTLDRANHNSEIIKDKIYTFSGKSLSTNGLIEFLPNKIEIYEPRTGSFQIDETNPHQAINVASFVYNDKLFVAGGSVKKYKNTGKVIYTNKVHAFDPESGYWQEMGAMPEAKETSGVLVNSIFYFIGGYNKQPLSTIETFNLKNGKWARLGEMFEPSSRPPTATKDGLIYIYNSGNISIFDTTTNSLTEYKTDLIQDNPSMFLYQNALYILGGVVKMDFETKPANDFFKIELSEFNRTKSLKSKILGK